MGEISTRELAKMTQEDLGSLQALLIEVLAPLIAGSPNRDRIVTILTELADQETDSRTNPDLHYRADMAEHLLDGLSELGR
jgi:hypothetical protein